MGKKKEKLRYAALLDTETTSLEPPPKGATIEIAVQLFDLKYAQPVASYASLLAASFTNEAYEINGIPPEMLPHAPSSENVWASVKKLIAPAQIIVAHNAAFDKQFTPDLERPWICSENDIEWPGRARGGSLAHLALSLGLGVASAHRATADVDTLSRTLTRLAEKGHDLSALLTRAMRPKAVYHALVSYNDRELAKAAGFRWEPDTKVWWREMFVEEAAKLPFNVKIGERPT